MGRARERSSRVPSRQVGRDPHAKERGQIVFVGMHERQLDDKGRLALPASFRTDLQGSCYLSLGSDRCVTIFAPQAFESMATEMIAQERRGEISQSRLRAVAGSASQVAIDKQGRLTVDERLREYAQLDVSSKVIVSGRFDRAEIWSEELYAAMIETGQDEMAGSSGLGVAGIGR
jgi:MraZ protein